MTVWLLTVWLTYQNVDKVYVKETFATESECRQWQAFYSEYPFRTECIKVKNESTS